MAKLNTDTATIVGYWVGVASFFLGIAGIGITLYSFWKDQPDIVLLTGSGWIAATLCSVTAAWIGTKLVNLLATQTIEIADLTNKLAEASAEKQRLITISDFLASKAIRQTTRKQIPINQADATIGDVHVD